MKLVPKFISKMFHTGTAPEGQWRPTVGIGEFGGIFQIPHGDGYQRNLGGYYTTNGTVMACVSLLARILSASYPTCVTINELGGKTTDMESKQNKLLMNPNSAQNVMEFVSNIVFNLCFNGNSYYYIKRDGNNNPSELIPLPPYCNRPFLTPDGDLFYDISPQGDFATTLDMSLIAPARDVLHIKLPSRTSLLVGDSMISYAYAPIAINEAINGGATAFFNNMNRPSGVLSTDQQLTGAQMTELRDKFNEVSKGMNQGKVPVLGYGMKWQPMSISAQDAQILDTYRSSVLDICRIFGVPIQLLGIENMGTSSSISALIDQFKTGNMLYLAELIEFQLETMFRFDHKSKIVEFDFESIARADFKTEIETLSKAVQNAIYSPNEARNRVGLDAVPYGDEPRIQAQNVRLQDAVPAPSAPSAGQPASTDEEPDADEEPDDEPIPADDEDTVIEQMFNDPDYVLSKLNALISKAQQETSK